MATSTDTDNTLNSFEETEWKDLATLQQFRVESQTIKIADFTTRGYILVNDVLPGIWGYNQHLENDLPAQLIAFNQQYREQTNTGIANDWSVPDGTFDEKFVNSYFTDRAHEFRDLGNGWHVAVCGLCVDGANAGIYDAQHFHHDPTISRLSAWSEKLNDMMDEQEYPLLMNVPYGIVSRDADTGDGTYACLIKKDSNGKVVAVKVIIQSEEYE